MKQLESITSEALATASAVQDCLWSDEQASTFLCMTSQRRLTVDREGNKRLGTIYGALGGLIRMSNSDREIYIGTQQLDQVGAADAIAGGRRVLHLGRKRSENVPSSMHSAVPKNLPEGWETTSKRLDLEHLGEDHSYVSDALQSGAGGDTAVEMMQISEIVKEAVFVDSLGSKLSSRCYGIQVRAALTGGDSTVHWRSRYATSLEMIDLVGLGRELRLAASDLDTPHRTFTGDELVLTPTAASEFLRHLVSKLLADPLSPDMNLCTELVDDGLEPNGYSAQAFDSEGTATGRICLLNRKGVQHPIATRLRGLPTSDGIPKSLTGHALWDPQTQTNYPQPSATNVYLVPTCGEDAVLAGERCLGVAVQHLGVQEHRSGNYLTFLVTPVKTLDGCVTESLLPIFLIGTARDFLAAISSVAETTSFFPGAYSVGGSFISMKLDSLRLRDGRFSDNKGA